MCQFIKEGLLQAALILCGLAHKGGLLPERQSLSCFMKAAPVGVTNEGEGPDFHYLLGLLISVLNTYFTFNVLGFLFFCFSI